MKRLLFCSALLLCGLFQVGCEAKECTQMRECCKVVGDLDGMGQACGALAEGTKDPATCKSVTQNIRFMLKDRKKTAPPICQAAQLTK